MSAKDGELDKTPAAASGGRRLEGSAAMTTATIETRITQSKKPVLAQYEMERIREAAAATLNIRHLAPFLPYNLDRATLQLVAACDAICEIVQGSLGTSAEGEPEGDLVLRASKNLPAAHQPKLRPTEDAA